jgi:general secretion pathway protein L
MLSVSQPGRIVTGIAQWWLKESRAVVPARLRSFLDVRPRTRLVLQLNEDGALATVLLRNGKVVFAGASEWRTYSRTTLDMWRATVKKQNSSFELVLVLSDAAVIFARLPIPAQAEPHIEEILRDHIKRKIPLPLESVLLGYSITPVDHQRLIVRYAILSKERLNRALARLQLRSDEVSAVVLPGKGDEAPIEIAISATPRRVRPRARRLAGALVAACLGFVAVGAATTAWRQDMLLRDVEKRVGEIAMPARQVAQQLRQLEDDHKRIGEMLAGRKAPSVVMIWEELARVVPETTYLTEISVRGQELQITGFSAAATDVIPLLDKSPLLRDVGLSGPVLMDRATGRQQFSLRARLRSARLSLENGE